MMCVMLAMISTATYAWFTMSESATVTGLQMTAVTNGGLMVSTDRTNWSNAVELRSTDADNNYEDPDILTPVSVVTPTLTQLTGTDGTFFCPQFRMPEYDGAYLVKGLYPIAGNGSSINDLLATNLNTKAVKKTFYIKEGEGTATNVGIEIADASVIVAALKDTTVGLSNGKSNLDGSFVVLNDSEYANADNAYDDALEAVRIGLVVYSNDEQTATLKIWEPNADMTVLGTATYATNNVSESPVTPTVKSEYDGTVTLGGSDGKSNTLISLEDGDGDGIRVDVFMWFEGQDDSCVNEIMADTIIAQLKFVEVQ